ncbi:tRNA (guanosine(18)-2'-O)-methyltransferase TrmH [Porticoccaceae bacterium LTM1]|nr:tRNA (guanosine(18)-2'-O)-methyltransferase TrmH [Porticoccaceae bacterium LTM1]
MTPERFQKIVSVLNHRQPDLTVITDDVHKGQNLSAIVRTCDAVGIPEVHAVYSGNTYKPHTGTAMGSQKWVQANIYQNVEQPIEQLQKQGYQVVAAHFSERAVDFRDIDYCKPTAVLFGAERDGVSDSSLEKVDGEIIVPMLGMVTSFNVSVACAIILSEAQRQRQVAGLYKEPRLDKKTYDKLLFEWCHPVIADYCKAKGLEYPELNENGDLIDPEVLKTV